MQQCWTSSLVRWHVRHVIGIWFVVRVIVVMALAFSLNAPSEPQVPLGVMVVGTSPTLVSFVFAVALATVDRRRVGAPLLFANLGYSTWWLVGTSAVVVVTAEILARMVLRVMVGGTP